MRPVRGAAARGGVAQEVCDRGEGCRRRRCGRGEGWRRRYGDGDHGQRWRRRCDGDGDHGQRFAVRLLPGACVCE